MVHDGKVYIYDGHDECPPLNEYYLINEWCVFSSPDLKTWTEHSVPLKAKDFSWAKGEAWASQVIERDGKFYWYVTVEHKTIPGKSIGVACLCASIFNRGDCSVTSVNIIFFKAPVFPYFISFQLSEFC